MAKLTVSQMSGKIGVSVYTLKNWYNWYESLSENELKELTDKGMPKLPECDLIGATNWRYWDSTSINDLIKFKNWVPVTKNGIFKKYGKYKKEDK